MLLQIGVAEAGMSSWPLNREVVVNTSLISMDGVYARHLSGTNTVVASTKTSDLQGRRKYRICLEQNSALFSTVTVPPVPENEVYVCGHIGRFKQVNSHRIAPTPLWSRRWHCCQLVRRGDLAIVHGCTCSATLGCWRSGDYGF